MNDNNMAASRHDAGGFSFRAVLAGMLIGILVNISNTYYGLIAGSSQQMPIVSAILGYLGFQLLSRFGARPLSKAENVLIASTATATGCMPVTAGFAELIPSLEFLLEPADQGPVHLSVGKLVLWSLGVAFFGIIFASLLRKALVMPHDMPWPGATASSNVIKSLHVKDQDDPVLDEPPRSGGLKISKAQTNMIFKSAAISSLITIVLFFIPVLTDIPIFGSHLATTWLWSMTLSPGFFGGGMIMGPEITLHMLTGAIVGWGILAPFAKAKGYAPGPIGDWDTGSRGWIIWISLAALIADAVIKIGRICFLPLWQVDFEKEIPVFARKLRDFILRSSDKSDTPGYQPLPQNESEVDDATASAPANRQPTRWCRTFVPMAAFIGSILFCMATTTYVFPTTVPWYHVFLSVLLALPMAVISIRTLGESDYNPQSGLLSQLFFASITPRGSPTGVIVNIVSSAISTAGASQTGDLAYDFKIGQLVGAAPSAQLYGQIVGSIFGALVSCATFKLYAANFKMPGPILQVPASYLQISAAKLVLGRGLPEGASCFALGFGIFFACATLVRMIYHDRWWCKFIPSGVSFAVGIFLLPAYTLSRTAGGLAVGLYAWYHPSGAGLIEVVGSGLILGEAITSLVTLLLSVLGMPQFGPLP